MTGADPDAIRLAQVRPFCPGTGAPVAASSMDGGNVTTCPSCRHYRLAYPIFEDPDGRYTVEAHFVPPLPRRTPGASLPLFEAVL